MIKRYALFAGVFYYAQGGWHDFVVSSDDVEALKEDARILTQEPGEYEWWHIVDLETMGIVAGTEAQAHEAPDIKGGES